VRGIAEFELGRESALQYRGPEYAGRAEPDYVAEQRDDEVGALGHP
jgi:hypothetical protein